MKTLTHLTDAALRRELIAAVAHDRAATAELLAHIAEFDARKLYVPEGYSSMHAYCVVELRLSEDAAYKRIQAARVARRFPAPLEALAEGRIHLAAVCLLAPHLTEENAEDLIAAAKHRRKAEVEDLIARRFSPWMPMGAPRLAPGQVGGAECSVFSPPVRRFTLHLSVPESTHEKLAYARALLSHAIPSGDVVQLLDRALDALIAQVEKRRIGAGARREARPAGKRPADRSRYIPAPIRRAVWERDGGRCTFVSKGGHRCGERRLLEFDHVEPVARGGAATVNGIRLRCRAHNQYEAERILGAGFMARRRGESRLERAAARAKDEERRLRSAAREQIEDVVAGLRALGCRADQARRAAELSATGAGATLEERMRAALKLLGRRSIPTVSSGPGTVKEDRGGPVRATRPITTEAPITTAPPATFAAPPECCPRLPAL